MRQKLVFGMSSGWMSAQSNCKCTIDSAAVKLGNVHGTNQGNYGHSIRCSCRLVFSKYPVKVHVWGGISKMHIRKLSVDDGQ